MIELEQIIKEELLGVNNKKIKEENLKEYLTSLKKEELIKMAISQTFIDKNYFDLYRVNNLKNKAKKEIIDYITEKLDKILESFIKIIKTEEIEQLENVIKNNGKKILFDDLKVSIRFILLLKNFSLAKVEYKNKEDSLKIFMPKEFVDIFNNCFKNKKLLELNNYNNKVYNYVRDVINTYGIVTLDKLYELFESQMFKIDKKDLKHIIEIVTIYEEEHIYEYNGETLLCSVEFGDEDYALYFYDSQKMDYKRYSKEDYKNISSFKYVEKLKAYKKFVNYLCRNYGGISEDLEYINDFIVYDYLASAQTSIETADYNFRANIVKILEVNNGEIEELLKLMKNIFKEYPKWIKRGNV